MPSILLFGVTGLVGSHLILELKDAYPEFPITVYLRNAGIDTYLKQTAGVQRVVHGTYDEFDKIASLSKEHDIVINVGSSWDTKLSEAIVAGLEQRPDEKKTTLIHMSGAGNFVDKTWSDGAHHEGAKIWNDDNVEDMKLLNPAMLNGGPDEVVLNAGKEGKIGTYIVFPPVIHGESLGPIRALGVIQLLMQEKVKELGFVPYVGEGSAIVNAIHVKDVTRFMLLLLALSLRENPQNSVYERCFIIGGLGEPWKDVADAFAKALHAKGLTKSAEAKRVDLKDAGEGEIPMLMASDMMLAFDRAERLGFQRKEAGLTDFLAEGKDLFLQ